MGLRFIFGPAGSGKTNTCCNEIKDYLMQSPEHQAIFLVPDQGTYRAESMLAAHMPAHGFTRASVSGFSRLGYRIFQEMHSSVSETLPPLGQQLVLSRILSEHRSEFHVIARASEKRHFAESMTAFFHELDTYLITEDRLASMAEVEGNTPLGLKLKDTCHLYSLYHQYLASHFNYQGSPYDLLIHEIPRSSLIASSEIWIDGFNGMTPQEVQIVYALIEHARQVTLTLSMDSPETAASLPVWNRPYHLYSMLMERYPGSYGTTLSQAPRFHSPGIRQFTRDCLTSPYATARPVPFQDIHILTAADTTRETDEIARRIVFAVKSQKLRYRDILVLLRNPEDYMDVLIRKFHQYKIPAFFDYRESMNNHPLILLLSALLQFLTAESTHAGRGWSRNRLFRLLKNDLFTALSASEVDMLESFVLKNGIRPGQWKKEWRFHTAYSVDSDTETITEKEKAEQAVMNELRSRLLSVLNPLAESWKASVSVKDKCTLLYHWLIHMKIPEALSAWDDEEFKISRQRPSVQVWKKTIALLDEIVHVTGNDAITPEDFLAMAEDGLSSLTYSMIPPTLDHVTVTTIERGYASEGKMVFVPGINEGKFPCRIDDTGFITEGEKQHIQNEMGISLGPDMMRQIYQEQFYVYLALTRASDSLVLSCSLTGSDGKELAPSYLLKNILRRGYVQTIESAAAPDSYTEDHSFISNPDQALALFPEILRQGIAHQPYTVPSETSVWTALRNWVHSHPSHQGQLQDRLRAFSYSNHASALGQPLASRLFMKNGHFTGSISQFESYRKCPYRYYLEKGLHLEPVDQSDLDARDFGNYLHAGLHNFGDRLKQSAQQWRDISDQDIQTLSMKIAGEIAPRIKHGILRSDAAQAYTEHALNDAFSRTLKRLRNWSRQSSFNTQMLEKQFSLHLQDDLGKFFTLKGTIDRMDTCDNAAVIADYKTGNTTANLYSMLIGYHLQLIAYLLAVLRESKNALLPAAILYIYISGDTALSASVPSSPDELDEMPGKASDFMSGYFNQDEEIIQNLDHAFLPDSEDTPFIPVNRTKTGKIVKSGKLLTREEFSILEEKVTQVMGKLHEHIARGDIPIRPARLDKRNPCDYCPYKSICRFDRKLGDKPEWITSMSDRDVKQQLDEEIERRKNNE